MNRPAGKRVAAAAGAAPRSEYAALAAETVGDVVWVMDLEETRFEYVNPAVQKLRGFSVEETLKQRLEQVLVVRALSSCKRRFLARVERFLRGERVSYVEEFEVRTKAGGTVWTESLISLRENPRTGRVEAHGVTRDTTQRNRLEAQFRQSQKMEAVGQLAGGVAHDFNNILAATIMHLELLLQNPGLSDETCKVLQELMAQAHRATGLTRQLLLFSRRSVMQRRPVNVNEAVENLLNMLRRLIGEDIRLQWSGQAQLPQVLADVGMLEQVVVNLAVNARDAMPKGGDLIIATQTVELTPEQVPAHPEVEPGKFVCLSVRDSGCGMDGATLKRVFEPFFTTKDASKGTGLGLATVYSIVSQHQGWVSVESTPGNGSLFRVYLPALTRGCAELAGEAKKSEPPRGGRETLLLVEDDPAVRNTLHLYLAHYGYNVLQAVNGVEALKVWQRHGPEIQLLLTDMVMPEGVSGLDLAEKLRATKPNLPVIISSGYSTELVQHPQERLEGITYIAKPCTPVELAAVVRRCLDKTSESRGARSSTAL